MKRRLSLAPELPGQPDEPQLVINNNDLHMPANPDIRDDSRPGGALGTLVIASLCLSAALASIFLALPYFEPGSVALSLVTWGVIVALIWRNLRFHSHYLFGTANIVTTARAATTAVLAGFIPVSAELMSTTVWPWAIAIAATIALCMDGLDGYLARKSGLSSVFGARFDMETDAFLGLVITLLVWQSGKAGIWVLALGLMRYVFLGASVWFSALRAPLFASLRRKTICVIQVGALCLMLCPWLSPLQVTIIGAMALLCLTYSFCIDTVWLFRHHGRRSAYIDANSTHLPSIPSRSKP